MAKIIGNTTATPMAIPDWNQTDATKADYIKNKPPTGETVSATIENNVLVVDQVPDVIAKGDPYTLTEEDKATIVADVLAAMPVAEELSV